MNRMLLVAAVGATVLSLGCDKMPGGMGGNAKLDTDVQKGNYAIGRRIGESLKMQNVEADMPALVAGISDAMNGKEARLKQEDLNKAMMKMQELSMKKMQEAAEKNKAEAASFMEKNKTAAGVKTTDSGLQYIVVSEGTGKQPKASDIVKVHYTGTLTNGEKFDSSVDRGEPAEFPVGQVIKGWTESLQLMKVGAKYKLFVPPDLGYGQMGQPPKIPGNSVLVFDVELLDVKEGAEPPAPTAMPKGKGAAKGKKGK